MIKIATIGLGNAGSQVSQLAFSSKGIPGIAINSSAKDMESISGIKRVVIGDHKGAGKNRENAKAFLKKNMVDVLGKDYFISHIVENDVIFVISSIGGGTGSGMAPMMVDFLQKKFPNQKFVLIGIYPPIKESLAAQQNSLDYLKEIREHNTNATFMSYDNNRYPNLTTQEMMQKVNSEIVEDMTVIRGDYLQVTNYNSIDEKDMMKIIETPGRLVVYRADNVKEKDLDMVGFESLLLDRIIKDSAHVEIDKDRIVKRMGVITTLSQSATQKFDINVPEVKGYVGEPVEGFEHINIHQPEMTNSVYLVMSGLSLPNDRIIKLDERIKESLEALKKTQETSVLDDMSTNAIKELRSDGKTKSVMPEGDVDPDDIFGKY